MGRPAALKAFYDGWADQQAKLLESIRPLTPEQMQLAGTRDAWRQLLPVFDAERDRLKGKYGGTVTREATLKFEGPLTREVRLAAGGRTVVERMLVVPGGPHPRVYFLGLAGKNLDPDGGAAGLLFSGSF